MHNKSVYALIEHRGSRIAHQRISDVHAISADIHNYLYFGILRNLRDFYVLQITANVVIFIYQYVLTGGLRLNSWLSSAGRASTTPF